MDKKELDRYKWELLKRRGELSANSAESGMPISRQGDQIDRATASTRPELQTRLLQSDDRLLKEVEGALTRIRLGSFGICEVCGEQISRTRLEDLPWSRVCRDCEEREND